jgi:alpha-L-fucosidase
MPMIAMMMSAVALSMMLTVILSLNKVTATKNITTNKSSITIPVPSAAQLRYQSTDFVALIHFNMATYAKDGDPGCDFTNWNQKAVGATGPTSDPNTFHPYSKLNTTQWFDSITALGANIAVLTAKHGCGFLLWPTNATLPLPLTSNDNITSTTTTTTTTRTRPYEYQARVDVLQQFVDSASAAGVGYGFYYSIMKNFFLCRSFHGDNSCTANGIVLDGQHNVSNDEYHTIVKQHLKELYSNYGSLTEIWIDSKIQGFGPMLDRLQPDAGGTPSNPRQWCGTESGFPSRDVGPGPIWQTGTGFFGNASSEEWVDKFCDPQLYKEHIWFYMPPHNRQVRNLEELIPIYHDIVGRGMVMELAMAINRDGLVEPSHAAVYKQLGDWVRECYGNANNNGLAVWSSKQKQGQNHSVLLNDGDGDEFIDDDGNWRLKLKLSNSKSSKSFAFDRIVLQEDISVGQRIRNYTITLVYDNDDADDNEYDDRFDIAADEKKNRGSHGRTNKESTIVTLVSNGTSIGRKRIHLLDPKLLLDAAAAVGATATSRPRPRQQTMSIVLLVTHAIGTPCISMFGVYKPCYPYSNFESSLNSMATESLFSSIQ